MAVPIPFSEFLPSVHSLGIGVVEFDGKLVTLFFSGTSLFASLLPFSFAGNLMFVVIPYYAIP